MTISRSDVVDVHRVQWLFLPERLPESIGIAVLWNGSTVLEAGMDRFGATHVQLMSRDASSQFELGDLRGVLTTCESELMEWRERLSAPGEYWEQVE